MSGNGGSSMILIVGIGAMFLSCACSSIGLVGLYQFNDDFKAWVDETFDWSEDDDGGPTSLNDSTSPPPTTSGATFCGGMIPLPADKKGWAKYKFYRATPNDGKPLVAANCCREPDQYCKRWMKQTDGSWKYKPKNNFCCNEDCSSCKTAKNYARGYADDADFAKKCQPKFCDGMGP